ncbi:MAG: penicillin-binding protein 2 [Rhodospirillales bacterium]|nr:penicillin-binding protein 2 [Alphaproteobacteria bacterium]MBL6947296.1 penicillin-binding protein 2 [Rhodospirillales bacterium]
MTAARKIEGFRKQALEIGRNRLLVTGVVLTLAFSVIGVRLVDLTIFKGGGEPKLASLDDGPEAPAGRADIVDRNGILLATSLPTASLYANPKAVLNAGEAADKLISVLPELDHGELLSKLTAKSHFTWISRNLTPKQQYAINRLGLPGFGFQQAEHRVYPHGRLAAHALGLTDVDGRGISGLERYFDRALRSGNSIEVALDIRIQEMLSRELAASVREFQAIGAAGIVLDANSGEVVSMVSLPDFDPNTPETASGETAFNRVTKGVYEMGSTFKLFTAAMALDSGTVDLKGGYDASEPIKIARFTIRDFHAKNRWLSVPEIIVYSSNIGAAKMAIDVGSKTQRAYLGRFGMLTPVDLELPEIGRPLMPSRWRDINTMTISYGHGIAVSPVQLASGVAALVNGGLYISPTLLKRESGEAIETKRVLSPETSEQMRTLMRMVVSNGTGRKAAVKGYAVGGKTGTADKLAVRGYRKNATISSFVGAFPMDAPRYILLVMVDEPKGNARTFNYATGGWVAAPAVANVVQGMAPLLGMAPDRRPSSNQAKNQGSAALGRSGKSPEKTRPSTHRKTLIKAETKKQPTVARPSGGHVKKVFEKNENRMLKRVRAVLNTPGKTSGISPAGGAGAGDPPERALATY